MAIKRLFLILLILSGAAFGQLWSGVLAPARAIDWTTAGSTLARSSTLCVTAACNTFVSAGTGATAAQLNSAIASACGSSTYIPLPSGTLTIAAFVFFNNCGGVELRGSGPDHSTLKITDTGGVVPDGIYIANSDTNYAGDVHNLCPWTAGYAAGATSITVTTCSLGNISRIVNGTTNVIADQADDASDTGNIFATQDTGSNGTHTQEGGSAIGRPGSATCNTPSTCFSQGENITVATCVGANSAACSSGTATSPFTLTLSRGLYGQNFNNGKTHAIWFSNGPMVSGIGLEDFTLDLSTATNATNALVYMQNAKNVLIQNVRFVNSTASTGSHKHVWLYQSTHVTVRDSYFYGGRCTSESYGVDTSYDSSDNKIENNIFQHIASGEIEEGDTGSVFAYNYAVDNCYTGSPVGTDPSWQQSDSFHHGPGYAELREGNIGISLNLDNIHPSGWMYTMFRNYWSGHDPVGSKTENVFAVNVAAWHRYDNFVGNILGATGIQTNYTSAPSSATDAGSSTTGNQSAFTLGWSGNQGTRFAGGFTINNDPLVVSTLMRLGNCDAASGFGSCRFVAGENGSAAPTFPALASPSSTLPASFLYSSRPSWWPSILPFPGIGPDITGGTQLGVGGHVNLNPAAYCYLTVMGGLTNGSSGLLNFNSSNCANVSLPTWAPNGVIQGAFPAPTTGASTALTNVVNGGVKLLVYTVGWNTIESNTTPGLYSWTALDNTIATMHAAYPNELLEIVLAPASDISPNVFTPAWVQNIVGQHTCFCSSYPGNSTPPTNTCVSASSNHSGVPVMWENTALTAWNALITAVIGHIKGTPADSPVYSIAIGYQKGGENFPQCSSQQQALAAGGTLASLKSSWIGMNQSIDSTVAAASPYPIYVFGNVNCIGNTRTPSGGNNCDLADAEAASHVIQGNGMGIRSTCINISDLTNYLSGQPTCGDVFAIFQKYTVPKDIQEGGESSPTGQQGTGQFACLANGAWTQLLPFVQQHWGPGPGPFIHEGLYNDMRGTFDPTYTTDACWPRTGTGATSAPWAPYVNVLSNMTAGLPRGTSSFQGHSQLTGTSSVPTLPSCAPPNYCAYTGTAIVQPPATPNLGGLLRNNAVFQDTSFPGGLPSNVTRCTDSASIPDHLNSTIAAGQGGSGSVIQLFNQNSTMLRVETTGGTGVLTLMDPLTGACTHTVTAADNLTNPGLATKGYNFGTGSFDWSNPLVWYTADFNADTTSPLQVVKYTFNAAGQFNVVSPKVTDFALGMPLGPNVNPWQPNTNYAQGQYVSYTLSPSEAPVWQATTAYAALGDLIVPSVADGNTARCAYKVFVAGTSGSAHPTWRTTCDGANVVDNTVTWRNIQSQAVFIFQLTGAGGTSGASTPAFCPSFPCHPDIAAAVADNGLTWVNVGPNVQSTLMWSDFGGISQDSTRFCTGVSTNSYGYNGIYSTFNSGQGTGQFVVCYDSALNTFRLLNTITGIASDAACLGGTGYQCTGGTRTLVTLGTYSLISTGCGFFIHNVKGGSTMDYVVVAAQSSIGVCTATPGFWQPFAPFDSNLGLQSTGFPLGHWAPGRKKFVNMAQVAGVVGGFTGGAFDMVLDMGNPSSILTSWQVIPCSTSWVSGVTQIPPCKRGDGYDMHPSWAYNPDGQDNTPVCGSSYNVVNNSPVPVAAWQAEEICVSTNFQWADVASPNALQRQYRFAHTFNTGTSAAFSTQFSISEMSQDGKWLAWSSNWMCTLGTTSGGTSSLCGLQWQANTTYTAGQMLNPFASNSGSGTNYGVYQVTTGGTSAGSHPTWFVCNASTVNNTVSDSNGLVYKCLGSGNDRGDVFLVHLQAR